MDNESSLTIVERHCPPSKFTQEKYGTIHKINTETGFEYYIQLSNDDTMNWQKLDFLLTECFKKFYDQEAFVIKLLKLYNNKNPQKEDYSNFLSSL